MLFGLHSQDDTLSFGVQDNFTSETILRLCAPGFIYHRSSVLSQFYFWRIKIYKIYYYITSEGITLYHAFNSTKS